MSAAVERRALGGRKPNYVEAERMGVNDLQSMKRGIARAAIASLVAAMTTVGADSRPPASASFPGQVTITGYVRDETGRPVSGAEVRVQSSSVRETVTVLTSAGGAFSAKFPEVSRLFIAASHPGYGRQFTGGIAHGRPYWTAYLYNGPVPHAPVELQMRRGVVLRGRVVDPSGRPFADEAMFLVPSYVGSGPPRIEAATTTDGRFEFERMVLKDFALVPRGLDHWHPRTAGTYFRVTQAPEVWVEAAAAGRLIEVPLQSYTLVQVTLDVSALRTGSVQVWTRGGPDSSMGMALDVDANGRVRTVMELGVEHELWVVPGTGRNMVGPWTRGSQPQWVGTPQGPVTLRINPS